MRIDWCLCAAPAQSSEVTIGAPGPEPSGVSEGWLNASPLPDAPSMGAAAAVESAECFNASVPITSRSGEHSADVDDRALQPSMPPLPVNDHAGSDQVCTLCQMLGSQDSEH
jgi:hypothetical protein